MKLPSNNVSKLLEEEQITIEETDFTDPMAAKTDIEQRLRDGAKWSVCIIQHEHGMLLLGENNEGAIHGVLYKPLYCGMDSTSARIVTVILALLFSVGKVNELYAGTIARHTHVVVNDLMSELVSVEVLD